MTCRHYKPSDLIRREATDMTYDGHRLDHLNYFKNGAIVGYADEVEQTFLVVLKARD